MVIVKCDINAVLGSKTWSDRLMGGYGVIRIDGIPFWGGVSVENCRHFASLHAVTTLELAYKLKQDNIYYPVSASEQDLHSFKLIYEYSLKILQYYFGV